MKAKIRKTIAQVDILTPGIRIDSITFQCTFLQDWTRLRFFSKVDNSQSSLIQNLMFARDFLLEAYIFTKHLKANM